MFQASKCLRKAFRIASIPADGIGKEVIPAAERVMQAALLKNGQAGLNSVDCLPTSFNLPRIESNLKSKRLNHLFHLFQECYYLKIMNGPPQLNELTPHLFTNHDCSLEFVQLRAGFDCFKETGTALPKETLAMLRSGGCDAALFGSVSSPSFKVAGYSSPIVALRKEMDLYANIRPISTPPTTQWPKGVDMLIIRENTECLYVKSERMEDDKAHPGMKVAWADRKISEYATRRIALVAFEEALERGQGRSGRGVKHPYFKVKGGEDGGKVTIVHKSNVLSVTDGLFREVCLKVQKEDPRFAGITVEEQLVDSMVYRMFREPHMFDVVVAPNLYGDILSDGAAALVGSLGVVGSTNQGPVFCMGEPVHGSAPDIEGKGIANPIASFRSGASVLRRLGLVQEASRIDEACDEVLQEGREDILTPDLGGKGSTEATTKEVISKLRDTTLFVNQ